MKFYIAFSIHGTNAFITATTETNDLKNLGSDFTEVKSRRPSYKPEDGIKLHWNQLLNQKGEPLRGPATVIHRFKQLEKHDWVIDKEAFVNCHYPRKK